MTTAYSSLMGLALPVQGELSGTWGDTVNNGITNYLDVALAGTQTISGNQTAVTLSLTNGNASATNIAQAGSGATGSAQYAIINCTGNPASLLTITVPASSRQYVVINATSTSQSVKVVGAGPTTGVTIVSGEKAHIVWNGSDFVKIASTAAGAAAGSNTQVQYNSSGSLAGSANLTFDGTTLTTTGNAVISDNSSNAALRITQTGAGNALVVEDSANPDSTPFVVDNSGSVFKGYTSSIPVEFNLGFQINGTGADSGFSLTRWAANTGSPIFGIAKSRGASVATRAVVQSGDSLGAFTFYGDDATNFVPAARIEGSVDGTPGTNDMPGRLVFSTTADGASSPTERMRIDNAGNVGIGTSSPGAILDVRDNANGANFIVGGSGTLNVTKIGSGAADSLAIFTNTSTEVMRLDTSGTVGIGLTPVANNGILQLNSYASVQAMMEKATVSATAATGTINFDAATQPVLYYTTNSSGNWTINIRGSSSLTLDSMMQTGQSLTLAFLATNGATAYYQSALTIDGASVTPKWQGGTAPTAGNASAIDAYVLTVIKTGSATFTVLASQTKFA